MFDLFQTRNLVAPHPQINLKPKEKQKQIKIVVNP